MPCDCNSTHIAQRILQPHTRMKQEQQPLPSAVPLTSAVPCEKRGYAGRFGSPTTRPRPVRGKISWKAARNKTPVALAAVRVLMCTYYKTALHQTRQPATQAMFAAQQAYIAGSMTLRKLMAIEAWALQPYPSGQPVTAGQAVTALPCSHTATPYKQPLQPRLLKVPEINQAPQPR